MFFLYKPVQLVQSKKVLLKDPKFGQVFEEKVIREKGQHSNKADLYFINKKNKYIWDETIQMFRKLRNVDESLNQSDFHKMIGLEPNEVKERLKMFGLNIIKISVPPVLHLIIHEVFCYAITITFAKTMQISCVQYLQGLNPFFLFQFYTVILWTLQWYWKFALIIAVTTVITVTLSVWEARRVSSRYLVMKCKYLLTVTVSVQQNRNLRDTMKSESKMRVVRNNRGTHTATHRHIAIMLRLCFIISNIIE